MLTLALVLSCPFASLVKTDDPSAPLREAVERLEQPPGYAFEMQSEYHGGLGGLGSGRIGRPRDATKGVALAGGPTTIRHGGIELVRSGDAQAYRVDGGEWTLDDGRYPPRVRADVSMLVHTPAPHELLRLALDSARDVSSTRNAATDGSTWRIDVQPDGARRLAGELARERRGATRALGLPEKRFACEVIVVLRDGRVAEIDADLEIRHHAGAQEHVQRRSVTYTLGPPPEEPEPVPEGACALLGLSQTAPPADDGEKHEHPPASSGDER